MLLQFDQLYYTYEILLTIHIKILTFVPYNQFIKDDRILFLNLYIFN